MAISSSPATSNSEMKKIRDILVDVSMKAHIVGSMEWQQAQDDSISPLVESAIPLQDSHKLEPGDVRMALHAFSVVFNFDTTGDQVTAAMLGETQGVGERSLITVYIAKNSGISPEDQGLGQVLSTYFNDPSKKMNEVIDHVFDICSRKPSRYVTRKSLKSTQVEFNRQGFEPWGQLATQIDEFLKGKHYSHSSALIGQKNLLRDIWSLLEKNETTLKAFREWRVGVSVQEANIDHLNNRIDELCRLHMASSDLENFKSKLNSKYQLSFVFVEPQHPNIRSIDTEVGEKFNALQKNEAYTRLLPSAPRRKRSQEYGAIWVAASAPAFAATTCLIKALISKLRRPTIGDNQLETRGPSVPSEEDIGTVAREAEAARLNL
ncbi:hypothetical protein O1611_g5147 [Lasiodiplodia mahajangana]|uniref:Uncharacterized protein n=1 Tax=Lasiodiplodia mahajangana TaxID=1108764 RepID=A0ACC2JLZ4_9PEZI|nr:hypothetical protein O1611_g5147 [Lasiodiplodia mahajangana]